MKTNQLLLSLLTATIGVRAASLPQHDDLLVNSSSSSSSAMVRHRETLNEAAANVRRLLRDVPYGSIATVFPPSSHVGDEIAIDGGWRKPGEPFAMLEYRESIVLAVDATNHRLYHFEIPCCAQTHHAWTFQA